MLEMLKYLLLLKLKIQDINNVKDDLFSLINDLIFVIHDPKRFFVSRIDDPLSIIHTCNIGNP